MSREAWTAFTSRFAQYGDRPALRSGSAVISYRELSKLVEERGNEIVAAAGPARERIVITSDDMLESLLLFLGAWAVDKVPVLVRENTPAGSVQRVAEFLDIRSLLFGGQWVQRSDGGPAVEPGPNEAMVLTTSGTSGLPKFVALPDASPSLNADAIARDLDMTPEDRVLVAQPLSHVYGLVGGALTGLWAGAEVHLLSPHTPGPILHRHVRGAGLTVLQGAPSFWRLFLAMWRSDPFESVRVWTTASEAPGRELIERIERATPRALGVIGFGMTEAGPRVSHVSSDLVKSNVGAVGIPFAHIDWTVTDPGTDGVGTLCLRGPSMFSGYVAEDGRYSGYRGDGFFETSDLVSVDASGSLLHKGRADQRVKVGGHLINPAVLEQLVLGMDGVDDACVLTEDHPILDRELVIEIVRADGNSLSSRDVINAARSELEPSLVPRKVRFVDAVQRTGAGKRRRTSSSVER